MAMYYSILERINNILWEEIIENKLSEFQPDKFCQSSVYIIVGSMSVLVFINNMEWEVNLKYQVWYFAIAMQRFLLWWEILNIIIHSYNESIKTHVPWFTKLTVPIVCCWYGSSSSVGDGNVFMEGWKTEFEKEKLTKIQSWEW